MTDGFAHQLRMLLGLDKGMETADTSAASLMMPDGPGPHPVVLYCHAHGGDHALGRRELTDGARWLTAPYGPDLLAAGFAVLCVDMPGFGDRVSEGSESALTKAGLWQGRPLFGQMVATQLAALDRLASDVQIDATRILALGVSMGAALAMWVAALDRRVRGCAQLCILANIAPLIASGAHDRHGPYLTVPGLLDVTDMGHIAGHIAPRPQFIGLGADDGFTPPGARDPALAQVRRAYGDAGPLTVMIAPDSGHCETPQMRTAVLDFLRRAAQTIDQRVDERC